MNKPDNIETKIENLCSAMEAGDHKAFAEIISSEDNWKKAEDQLCDCGFMHQFINEAKFSSARKKSLLKLMVKHRFDIAEPYNFNMIAWNLPILKFVLSEFSIPDKSIEEGILYREQFGWDPLPLRNLKICFDHGYTPSEDGLKALLFFSAESFEAASVAYLLEKYDINVNQGLGHNPYAGNVGNTLYFGYSNSSPLTFASHWLAYGVCHAATNKFFKLAKVLLKHGADVNFASHDSGITALMCASHIGIFNFLLRHGADLYAVTKKLKKNMLQRHAGNYACGLPIVKKLVEKYHFDIHYRDASGKTALNYAIGVKNYDVIHYLCKHGALEDVEDIEKFVENTVTWLYSEREKLFVTHLMKYGFDKDGSGRHLLDYCDKAEIDPEWLNICIEEESGLDDGFLLSEFSESQISEIEKIIARKVKK